MKKLIILITVILLIANALLGVILSGYGSLNVYLNSAIILINGIILYSLYIINLKDAFRYSLTSIFGFVAIVEYALGFCAPTDYENNWFAIFLIITLAVEILIIISVNFVTSKNLSKIVKILEL